MKQIVFTIGYLMAIGGWNEHSGFLATTFFVLLYVLNFMLSEQAGWLENFIFNKLLFWATGIGGIIGFFLNTFLKWILRIGAFAIYFVPQPTLEEELSGMGDILMGWWIVWGLLTIWSLCKKCKSA